MNVLVTGATGNVGAELIRELSNRKVSFVAAVHSLSKAKIMFPQTTKTVPIEYTDPWTVNAAFQGVDRLFLLTPFVPNQVEMAKVLVDAAKAQGVKQIVKQSFSGVENETLSAAGKLHREAERYIEGCNIPYTFLRSTSFMQNYLTRHADTIKTHGKIFLEEGHGRVNYVDVRDIAAVAAAELTGPIGQKNKYYITGPKPLSGHDVAKIFTESLGKPIVYEPVTEEVARKHLQELGMSEWAINALLEVSREHRENRQAFIFDTVKKITGKEPRSFRQFVEDFKDKFAQTPLHHEMSTP